nr:retrotransposon protein, putative, Ty1-copia subclass [Tanacetum cinerariifolium]
MGKTINELHAMLKLHEQTLPKNNAPALHAIRAGKETEARHFKLVRGQWNNMVYFSVVPWDGIFEIDLSDSHSNVSSMAFEKCVPCMSGKMARKLYSHQVDKAKDLLRLIHTDVCGPFKIVSRQGASYFVTFTDDFSHYGYVYMLKHKHEVFETFKVFQKEVENQLGKAIKSIRSDREGEYMSQEFVDHLKDHRVIAYRTPPYTPQHNGVSERRNRTLLDIFRSMISQTTLPKSFKDYPFKTAAPNMVPTKKVEKTPYEVWHGQAPKLSYLKVWVCKTLVKRDTLTKPDKLEPRSIKCIIIGYPKETIDIRAIRIFIAITAFYDYEIWQMDVKTAFFNKYLSEEVYMKQPEGFVNPKYPNRVCKRKRSIYGLKKASNGSNVTLLILYADDILIMKNNIPMLQDVKSYLGRCFSIKDLGEAAYILGIKIYIDRSRRLVGLCQIAYIEKILQRYHMENSNRRSISMENKLRLSKSQGASTPAELKRMQNVPYAFAVGSIMYATGYVFVLNEGAADWKSAKQSIFATSSVEAEYIAAFDDSKEAVCVRKFIYGLGVVPIIEEPISMYCDNTRAITIANESRITKGARCFRAKVHYLQEVIEYGDVKLEKVHTDDKLADFFTKALAFPKHSEHT